MSATNYVVITSINPPTKAVDSFSQLQNWQTIVVGDRKTPEPWQWPNVIFIGVEQQIELPFLVYRDLSWNHYSRKMLGYLIAISQGATVIFDTDDDNIPKSEWHVPPFDLVAEVLSCDSRWVNIYRRFSDLPIWPRGFPLKRLLRDDSLPTSGVLTKRAVKVGVWQALADGDPDVDAIYRLTDNTPCYFDDRAPVVLAPGTACPFNSQVTAFRRELFPLLYIPSTVTFRFTDILRGLIAQPIMWAAGYSMGFLGATVVQERNAHDYLKDFESEIPCYLFSETVLDIATNKVKTTASMTANLLAVYAELVIQNIVQPAEMKILANWLADLERIG